MTNPLFPGLEFTTFGPSELIDGYAIPAPGVLQIRYRSGLHGDDLFIGVPNDLLTEMLKDGRLMDVILSAWRSKPEKAPFSTTTKLTLDKLTVGKAPPVLPHFPTGVTTIPSRAPKRGEPR